MIFLIVSSSLVSYDIAKMISNSKSTYHNYLNYLKFKYDNNDTKMTAMHI